MNEHLSISVLRKMLTQKDTTATDAPLTVTRALRLSAARAAERAIGLELTVRSVSEEILKLDALMSRVNDELLLLQLHKEAAIGIAAFDMGLLAAIVESQTMGELSANHPVDREMTAVDASLAEPFLSGLLLEMTETIGGTDLQGWTDGVVPKGRYLDLRQIGLTLPNTSYRLLQMSIDLNGTDRSGNFYLVLPVPQIHNEKATVKEPQPDWKTAFPETVGLSQASLPVVLHRFGMSLSTLNNLDVGQTIALSQSRVDLARLEMPDGTLIAKGRLGQMAGHFAIRLEDPTPDVLEDLSTSQDTMVSSQRISEDLPAEISSSAERLEENQPDNRAEHA